MTGVLNAVIVIYQSIATVLLVDRVTIRSLQTESEFTKQNYFSRILKPIEVK